MINIDINIPKTEGLGKIIVEAGHIYTNEIPGLDQESGVGLGGVVSDLFSNMGYKTENWLFIDDYNPQFDNKPIILDEKKYISFLKKHNFSPDKIIHESEMVDRAKDALEILAKKNMIKDGHKDGKIYLTKGNVLLYDPKTNIYSCPLLDACLYTQKLDEADLCVTILSKKWTAQQKNTKQLVKRMGYDPEKVIGVFYSNNELNENYSSAKIQPVEHVTQTLNLLSMVNGISDNVAIGKTNGIRVDHFEV